MEKFECTFSRNVLAERRKCILDSMRIKAVEGPSKYLGLPTFVGRSKKQVFEFIQDRVWKKLKGWKEKYLTAAGREVLIKAVAQSIPSYVMGCFLLPSSLCDHLESMISKFWWGSKQGERKIYWISWERLCSNKYEGGMGFRSFRAFNEALLAKQSWGILSNPSSLLSKCL